MTPPSLPSGGLRQSAVHGDGSPVLLAGRSLTYSSPSNAGLLFDRYIPLGQLGEVKAEDGASTAFDELASLKTPAVYASAFQRWQAMLRAFGEGTLLGKFEEHGRIAVGLGGDHVHDSGLVLHRVYGTPVIPGSALKGLAHRYARDPERGGWTKDQLGVVFGNEPPPSTAPVEGDASGSAGFCTFFDAWWIPSRSGAPLSRDVLTVHHQPYYRSRGGDPPWDFDDPIPVPFLSVRGSFLVAIHLPDAAWAQATADVLAAALADFGVGAKTSSGYGRLLLQGSFEGGEAPAAVSPEGEVLLAAIASIRSLKPEFGALLSRWRALPEADKLPIGRKLAQQLTDAKFRNNAGPRELLDFLGDANPWASP